MSRKSLKRKLSGYGGALTTKLKQSLQQRGNVAFGKLINSLQTRVIDEGASMSLEVRMQGYGWALNKNYKPSSMPPVDAILAWMDRKGIKMDRSKSKYRLRTRKQVAYLIARAIQKKGFATYNNHQIGWFDVVIQQEMSRLQKNVKMDLYTEVRDMFVKTLGIKGGESFQRY